MVESSRLHARSAATCRWAVPTLFLASPLWCDAESSPWTCGRDVIPRILATTDVCQSCSQWEARARRGSIVPLLDWFGTCHPHEVR